MSERRAGLEAQLRSFEKCCDGIACSISKPRALVAGRGIFAKIAKTSQLKYLTILLEAPLKSAFLEFIDTSRRRYGWALRFLITKE
ncbi:hypothetical protein KF913_12325 [Candidatus Obscuribacterales bacterium]|nr:hypothetical protein [Candidatus Obscuribacterales bacterium]